MKNLSIRITGSGTKQEIVSALNDVFKDINSFDEQDLAEGQSFEDNTLYTEIEEDNG